ncbi:hypothetical protein BDW59DRAFT_166358 [Aspergillus cavernicola]|uniref:Uncharacterized protein n=1 Tax=Aspergillus cavernicola TaxID=176166 RepID=A0ABR4HM18_9EURO
MSSQGDITCPTCKRTFPAIFLDCFNCSCAELLEAFNKLLANLTAKTADGDFEWKPATLEEFDAKMADIHKMFVSIMREHMVQFMARVDLAVQSGTMLPGEGECFREFVKGLLARFEANTRPNELASRTMRDKVMRHVLSRTNTASVGGTLLPGLVIGGGLYLLYTVLQS